MIVSKISFRLVSLVLMGILALNAVHAQDISEEIIGIWELEDKTSRMEIYKDSQMYYGKLLYGKDVVNEDGSSKKDIHNPNNDLRDQDIIGSTYIKELKFDGEEWEEGKVYDSSTGKTWNCYVQIKDGDLLFTGYWGAKWLGKTYVYKRIK